MSDDETRSSADLPLEPILLPESPFASPGGPLAPPRRRPRVWTVFAVFVLSQVLGLLAAALFLAALTISTRAAGVHPPEHADADMSIVVGGAAGFLGMLLSTMIVFLVLAIAAAVLSPVPWRKRLRLRAARVSPLAVVVSLCGILAISLALEALDALGALPQSPVLEMLADLVATLSGPTLWAAVFVIGVAPGIAEEVLFRGYIQTRLSKRWGPGWAILVTSLLFGLNHWDLVQGTFAVAIGIYLGYLTERTGTIWPAMLCHATNNVIATLTAAGDVDVVAMLGTVTTLVVAIVVVSFSAWYLRTFLGATENADSGEGAAEK